MITNCGAKYVARALCLWGAENNFLANVKRVKTKLRKLWLQIPKSFWKAVC